MRYQQFFLFIFIFFQKVVEVNCKECPEIKILNLYKSRSYVVEGVQIYGSTIQLLRGGPEPGTSGQINNIMVWDTSTNNVLFVFDLDLQISRMMYCKNKRKLIVAGTHKIYEIHPLTFQILVEHNIGGTYIHDVEDDDNLLLISRDKGNPFTYNINTKQVVASFPYQHEGLTGLAWSAFVNLKDFKLFINARLMIFDRSQDNKFIAMLNSINGNHKCRVVSIGATNMIVTTDTTNQLKLGLITKNSQGVTTYQLLDTYIETQQQDDVLLRFEDLYYINKDGQHYVVGPLTKAGTDIILYRGVTVMKVAEVIDGQTKQKTYKLQVQELWRYLQWGTNMEFFVFDEAAQRGHSIAEWEHYSYEFLESDDPQCDFDGDGVLDSYCRVAKIISHWPWNLYVGVLFTGPKGEYFMQANDNVIGYQIRDFNQTEYKSLSYERLVELSYFSMMRVIQSSKSTYVLPYDTYVLRMCWSYDDFLELKADHNKTAGFYIYQHTDFNNAKSDTIELINFMNPKSNTEKYKNSYFISTTFTYEDYIHICLAYVVQSSTVNYNGEIIDLNLSYQYFSHHQNECYKIKSDKSVQLFLLKLPTPIDYSSGATTYLANKCTPYFDAGQLICKNSFSQLEIWSLSTYQLIELVNIDCKGVYELQTHRKRVFLGCDDKVAIYNFETKKISTLISVTQKLPRFLLIKQDIFVLVFTNMEIWVYDLSASDGSTKIIFQYLDSQDCCVIQTIDFHPVSKKILWASNIQINSIDITSCILNPEDCLTCELNAYFKYDPNFSFVKQKYERASWPTILPKKYVNQKFLDSGLGTKQSPYVTDMSIIQFYYKTMYYKLNIMNFKTITLNLYFDINKEQYMSNHLFDWLHPKTKVIFNAWDSTNNSQTPTPQTQKKIKISIISYKNYLISIYNWLFIDISNLQIACPLCSNSSLSFEFCGEIYLRNFKMSLKQSDLIDPQSGQQDTRVFPNIQINVNTVTKFLLENQFIGNTDNKQFETTPFFSFINNQQVILKDIVFSNISNQESIFTSQDSSIFLENITFNKLNTCKDTSQRQEFNLIPFNEIEANNITFDDNDFCDICLFQNIVSSKSQSVSNVIKISNIKVTNNRFSNYQTSTVVFLRMSLVSLFVTNQSIFISNITFQKNTGIIKKDQQTETNFYYFEIIKLQQVIMDNVNVIDEQLVGLTQISQVNSLTMKSIKFINSQFLPENSSVTPPQYLIFRQMVILASQIDKIIVDEFVLSGFSFEDTLAVDFEESLMVDLRSFNIADCLFKDTLFTTISNMSRKITSISLINSLFQRSIFTTVQSNIQVGLFWIKAEKSKTIITITNNNFTQNFLSINYNTQKKSSISISVDNSISDLTMDNCKFSNFHADSIYGDLFLNVKILKITKSIFSQNLSNLKLKSSPTPGSDQFIKELIDAISLTKMQGTFITVQAQDISISESTFQNAISQQGPIQIYPNNNELKVEFDLCTFKNLFASTCNSAVFLQSKTSPVSLTLTNSHFSNLWLGNIQSIQKSHIFSDTDSFYENKITIQNIDVQNIGILQSSDQTINQQSAFIYATNSSLYFQDTIINSKSRFLQKLFNQNEISEKLSEAPKLNRILQQDGYLLSSSMSGIVFYASSLIKVLSGPQIIIKNIEIHGSALINQHYKNVQQNVLLPIFLEAHKTIVKINNLQVLNIVANQNGGIMLVQESGKSEFNKIVLQNVNLLPLSNSNSQNSLENNISQSKAFLNCIQTYCSYQFLDASCDNKTNNKCYGRIINHQDASFSLKNSSFQNYKIDQLNGTAIILVNPGNEVLITNSKFLSLSTTGSGGGIYIFQNKFDSLPLITVQNNTFQNNEGGEFGGAISLESLALQSQEVLQITDNFFSYNTARIAAAIYYNMYYIDPASILKNTFEQNHAKLGDFIFSQPEKIHIKFDVNQDIQSFIKETEQNNKLTIIHYSGKQLPKLEFQLFYINQESKEEYIDVSLLQEQTDFLQLQMSLDQQTTYDPSKDMNGQQLFYITGSLFSQYNETNKMLYFSNLELFGLENSTIHLIITSPFIKKLQKKDIDKKISYEPYQYIITVQFHPCSDYEIITANNVPALSSEVKRCQVCPDLSFSKDKLSCEQCPIGADCNENEQMIIQSGYWRASLDTYNVIQCAGDFEGCIGGQGVKNEICLKGYVGPLCQECDLFNERGDGKFTRFGKKLCRLCSFDLINSVMLIGTLFTTIFITIRAVKSNTNFIKAKILVRFLKTIKFKNIRNVEELQNQNILIKILMTYFQLISIIRTVDIKIPDFFPEMSFYLGNPATNATLNVNCFMKPFFIGIHYLYYNYFLIILVPFIHFLILFAYLKVNTKLNKELMSYLELKASIIFLFTFFQPEFVYQAIQIITCKQIDKLSYNQSNLNLSCDINTSYFIIISTFIIGLGFLIPLILFARLTKLHNSKTFKQDDLEQSHLIFLSLNYNPKSYYWEFIRMAERLLFILVTSIFNDNQILKIIILIFVAEGYNYLFKINSPFKNNKFNKLEMACNQVIAASFVLAIGSYSRTLSYTLDIIFYVLFLFINWVFISYIIFLVAEQKIHQITDKLLLMIQKNKCVSKYFEKIIKYLIKPLFKLNFDLKVYLMQKKKPELYAKVKDTLLEFLKMDVDQRMVFMISLKEHKNKSKIVSEMMNSISESVKKKNSFSESVKRQLSLSQSIKQPDSPSLYQSDFIGVKPSIFKNILMKDSTFLRDSSIVSKDNSTVDLENSEKMKNIDDEEMEGGGVNMIIPTGQISERQGFSHTSFNQSKYFESSQGFSQNYSPKLQPYPYPLQTIEGSLEPSAHFQYESRRDSAFKQKMSSRSRNVSDAKLI